MKLHQTRMRLSRGLVVLGCLALLQASCAVPRMIWPQKNIMALELNSPSLEKSVLVAARSSEFKDAVVSKLRDSFMGVPVYIKFIGMEDLHGERAERHNAVILINTCMAGGFDRNVDAFLSKTSDQRNIIVLTTVGDANWKPDMKGRTFDAITTASIATDVDKIAGEITSRANALLAAS